MTIQFGCQTYTWQMSYEKYTGKIPHLLDVIQKSGFSGVEAEVCMLGPYYSDPLLLQSELQKRGLKLAALTLALPWLHKEETKEEMQEAEKLFNYLEHFPEARLILVQLPGKDRLNLAERQRKALNCINIVGRRAFERGFITAFHPNSPGGSVFRTSGDYEVMFEGLDTRYVGYCPDSGHIANGDMDPIDVIRTNLSIIKHVHFKDISKTKEWKPMGEGVIDHLNIVKLLQESNYKGWVMVEEESELAVEDPDGVTRHNGKYIKNEMGSLTS